MFILSSASLVLPDRILSPGSLVIEHDRIADVIAGEAPAIEPARRVDLADHYIVPGFIDVHVHGVEGRDSLEDGAAIAEIAARLPRYGVTAFCPTTVACSPEALAGALGGVRAARTNPLPDAARVLPAHLESNFINPDFRGAQPLACLRRPPHDVTAAGHGPDGDYTGADILAVIERARPDVGIVTVAPELAGAIDLIGELVAKGHRVSLGHSGATFEQGMAGIEAGARQGTHLFNRMPAFAHREPGLAGAVLQSAEVAVELICDGYHVHPAVVRIAIAAKGPERVMAITDGTAGAGLPVGSKASLGGRTIVVRETAAYLEDGTLAGSTLTMDRAFRMLVDRVHLTPVEAATVCSTTAARELGLHGHGVIHTGAVADLAVLDRHFRVVQTWIGGRMVYSRT